MIVDFIEWVDLCFSTDCKKSDRQCEKDHLVDLSNYVFFTFLKL